MNISSSTIPTSNYEYTLWGIKKGALEKSLLFDQESSNVNEIYGIYSWIADNVKTITVCTQTVRL